MLGPFHKMVVLGESTVQGGGWLQCEKERYADILAQLLQTAQQEALCYYNAGIGASVISPSSAGYWASAKPSAAERLDDEVIALEPDLLVIAYGLNDMRSGMPVELFRVELLDLIQRVRAYINPLIVLVNVYYISAFKHFPPFDQGSREATLAYNALLQEVAKIHDCLYADVYGAAVDCDHLVHQDTVHANKIGNMLIAHRIFEVIVRACPGIARSVREQDEHTPWTEMILPLLDEGREPSEESSPGE